MQLVLGCPHGDSLGKRKALDVLASEGGFEVVALDSLVARECSGSERWLKLRQGAWTMAGSKGRTVSLSLPMEVAEGLVRSDARLRREALAWWRRTRAEHFGREYWLRALARELKEKGPKVFVPDLHTLPEAAALRAMGGLVARSSGRGLGRGWPIDVEVPKDGRDLSVHARRLLAAVEAETFTFGGEGSSHEETGPDGLSSADASLFDRLDGTLTQILASTSPYGALLAFGGGLQSLTETFGDVPGSLEPLRRVLPPDSGGSENTLIFEYQALLEALEMAVPDSPVLELYLGHIRKGLESWADPWPTLREEGMTPSEVATLCLLLANYFCGRKGVPIHTVLKLYPPSLGLAQPLACLSDEGLLAEGGWVQLESEANEMGRRMHPRGGKFLHDLIRLGDRGIGALIEDGVREGGGEGRPEADPALRAGARPGAEKPAEPVPKERLEQLVLPEHDWWAIKDALEAFAKRPSVSEASPPSFLLTGPPGTGKTFAARAIAGSLGRPLHTWTAALLLDKHVGECEKRIRRACDGAAESGAVLLLDEADSLCWDRSDARHAWEASHTNTVLHELDRRQVPMVLASNLASKLDPALLRRMDLIVEFRFPGAEERERLWSQALAGYAWASGLDLSEVLRVRLSGGLIRNAAAAVDRDVRIGRVEATPRALLGALLRASRAEAPKLGAASGDAKSPVGFKAR
jgi:hypothetical protein